MVVLNDLKVGVVGASVGGRILGTLLERAGAQVTLLERSQKDSFVDRGAGFGIADEILKKMHEQGLVGAELPTYKIPGFTRMVPDQSNQDEGRVVYDQKLPVQLHVASWGEIFQHLPLPSNTKFGVVCSGIEQTDTDCSLLLADGSRLSFDAIVGADGYRSMVRKSVVAPEATEQPAGYILWRGFLTEADGKANGIDFDYFEGKFPFIFMPSDEGGHTILYLVKKNGERLLTWGAYINVSDWTSTFTDKDGVVHDFSIPPGKVQPELEAEWKVLAKRDLPAKHAAVLLATKNTFVQGIVDVDVEQLAVGRVSPDCHVHDLPNNVALVGDAAAVARPHTVAGVGKAYETAAALVKALQEGESVQAAFQSYSDAQVEQLRSTVALGKSVGRGTVSHTPKDIGSWDEAQMQQFLKGLSAIDTKHNIYQTSQEPDKAKSE